MGFYQAQKIEKLEARIAELEAALKDARDKALVEGNEIAFRLNGMPRSEIAQAFRTARAAYLGE